MTEIGYKEISLLVDTPEENVLFGFDEYASILTATIMGTKPHFTLGIFGGWGCGKTTLLRQIESHLKTKYPDRALVVSFDAWRYQNEEHFILALLNTISLALKVGQSHWQSLGVTIGRFSRCLVAATSVNPPFVGISGDKALEQFQKTNDALKSLYYNWLNQLQSDVKKIRKDEPKRRLVILIDDIDRCLPSKVIEILESIKVTLDVEGFVFVLALDQQKAETAIQSRYGEKYANQGRDYLKKLVQVEFRLPPLRTQDIKTYTGKLSSSLGLTDDEISITLAEVVPLVIGDNLREVKRFINGVILGTEIMRAAKLTVAVKIQIAFMAMDFRWAGITRTLASKDNLLKHLSSYLKRSDKANSLLPEDEAAVKTILQDNLGLQTFLNSSFGKELLSITGEEANQLLFFSSMTKEKNKAEIFEDIVLNVLSTLTPKEQRVLSLRFGMEDGSFWTLKDVAKQWNVTGPTVRKWESIALRKIRHPSRSRSLRSVLAYWADLSTPFQYLLAAIFGPDEIGKMNSKNLPDLLSTPVLKD